MRYFYLRIWLFFSIAIPGVNCFAQQLIFKTYGMNDGLVNAVVRKIHQDSKGFLWMATWEGLTKYDGHRFINYKGFNGLGNGVVNDIFETTDGTIYITVNDGSIYRINHKGSPQKINSTNIIVNKLVSVAGNKILALTDDNGIQEFKDGQLGNPAKALASKHCFNLIPVNDSLLLAQSDYSIFLLTHRLELFARHTEILHIFSERGLFKDSKNRVWVGTAHGLRLIDNVQTKKDSIRFLKLPSSFSHPLLQTGVINAILEDADGNLWFGTTQGALKISPDGEQQLLNQKNGLPADDVSCIFQDREKNIWLGGSLGLAKLVTSTSIRILSAADGLSSNNIFHLLPFDNGNLLLVSDKGYQLYNKHSAGFLKAEKINYSNREKDPSFLLQQASNYPYLVFQQHPYHTSFFSPTPISGYFTFRDQAQNFFYCNNTAVFTAKNLESPGKMFYEANLRTFMLDTKSNLWIGTFDSGLLRVEYENINGVPAITKSLHFLPGIGVRTLYEDSKGNIWVGSRYHGIFCISKEGSVLQQFNQQSGLTSNRITSIAEDKHGAIWLSFYSGLDKLVPENKSFRVFNFSRFHNFFTNVHAIVFDKSHSLWLGTTQGLVNITDGEIEDTEPPETIITSAILGDRTYLFSSGKKIELSYRQNNVLFEFAAPGFINEKQLLYSYRLLGSRMAEWSHPSNEHAVSFASLSSGHYQFEVRTLGWNGQWGEPAVFTFNIRPPFWAAWWFIASAGLLITSFIFLLVRRRIKNIRRNAELKHKLAEAEMMALRSQMNPHFIFNCLNAIDNSIQTNQQDKATTYLARFAKLIRSVLESSKNNLVPFAKDFETLNLFLQLEQFRCSDKFSYELKADEELLHGDYKVPPLIVQPFVENAIHHGLLNKQ